MSWAYTICPEMSGNGAITGIRILLLELEFTVSGKAEVGLGIKPAARYLTAASLKQVVRELTWGFVYAGTNKRKEKPFNNERLRVKKVKEAVLKPSSLAFFNSPLLSLKS